LLPKELGGEVSKIARRLIEGLAWQPEGDVLEVDDQDRQQQHGDEERYGAAENVADRAFVADRLDHIEGQADRRADQGDLSTVLRAMSNVSATPAMSMPSTVASSAV
jgi:hypothetical protein